MSHRKQAWALFSCLAAATHCLGANPPPKPAPPKPAPPKPAEKNYDPEAERLTFKVADGFEVNLFAADPMIAKPLQMTFDADGRMWVVSSSVYPMVKPGEIPNDKVVVLEDSSGRGVADKASLFAEGLLIPTGIALGDGGAYVANSTEIVHLKDADGDGKADARRVVLSGFGTEDTHHIVHCFRWGPDGRLYFNQSVYIHSHLETPWGTKRLGAGGIWRFRPENVRLDVLVRGMWNSWGHAWDNFGQDFATDGAFGEGPNYLVPGASFAAAKDENLKDPVRVLKGLNPGSPKFCGLEILSGRHLPDDYQGDLLTNDFRAHRVCRFKLSDSGAGYSSKQMPDFITSSDVDFRPIDVKVGPDGAVYLADWFNPIINHGEVDFRDPRRDKAHGRIWRVTAKGRPLVAKPKLSGAATGPLLERLKDPEAWTRDQVRLILRERPAKEVAAALAAWVKGLGPDDAGDRLRLEALWAYETIDAAEPDLLRALLRAKDGHVRAAAVRVLSHWAAEQPGQVADAKPLLAAAVADDFPRVRLEAVRALGETAEPESIVTATKALDKEMDPFLDYALWLTANQLKAVWLPAFEAGKLGDLGDPKHLSYALQAVKSADAVKNVVAQLKSGQTPMERRRDAFDLIAAVGQSGDLDVLAEQALDEKVDPGVRAYAMKVLQRTTWQRNMKAAKLDAARLKALFTSKDPALAAGSIRLAGTYHLGALAADVQPIFAAPQTPPAVRYAAAGALAGQGQESAAFFRQQSEAANPPAVRAAAAVGLAPLDLKDAAARAADVLSSAGPDLDPAPLVGAFLDREGGADALAAALTAAPTAGPGPKKINTDLAKLALRSMQTSGRLEPGLMGAFRDAAGIGGDAKPLTPDEMKQTAADVSRAGDAARGEQIFRSKGEGCFQCHAVAGAGGQLAPDLRTVGASAPVDYLVDSILSPNKAVKEGFNAVQIWTRGGEVYSGLKAREDAKEIVLKDNLHDEIVIQVKDVKRQKDIGSLMPAGLADALTRGEFLDLVRFLSELGKPGPWAIGNAPVVRRWRVLAPPPEAAATATPDGRLPDGLPRGEGAGPGGAAWAPAYSMVSGELPVDALVSAKSAAVAFARCEIDVTAPGKVRVLVNSRAGLTVWVDDQPATGSAGGPIDADLSRGVHAITFRVDLAARGKEGLRVELADVPGSAAHAQPVTGK